MHMWGDEWFEKNGDDLYKAEKYIYNFVKKWSKCTLISKEKYGTLRYEFVFPPGGAVSLRNADFILIKLFGNKKVTWDKGEYTIPRVTWQGCYLYKKWAQFGHFVLSLAIKKAIKKWPHIRLEISTYFEF